MSIRKLPQYAITIAAICSVALLAPAQSANPAGHGASQASKPQGKAFSSPKDAAAALYAAARRNDETELIAIFGPDATDLVNWNDNPNEKKEQRQHFADKYDKMHRLVREPDHTVALYVGAENWPLPIPLIEYNGHWYFDTEAGKQEILYRRIGRNETEAVESCRALVDAEKEFYAGVHLYTANFESSDGSRNGLYWKGADAKNTLIGPYLAQAGMSGNSNQKNREPFHGYYYRIVLSPQAKEFAVLAYPAAYRASGVMTFLIDQNGNAFEKDLGQNTTTTATGITSDKPDPSWKKVE
jgi:hypothetical protein